jgi:predicted transcriptional regulator
VRIRRRSNSLKKAAEAGFTYSFKEDFRLLRFFSVIFGEFSLVNYRGRLDIIADILHVVSGDAKKTQIMYQANLSYKVLQKYLAEISGASLISFEPEKQCYVLTNKGRVFLDGYQEYSKTNRHVAERLNVVRIKKNVLEKLCSSE